jgi:REP element-mobilizing transposase RayT
MANRPPRLQVIHPQYTSPLFFVTFNARNHRSILDTPAVHGRFIKFAQGAAERNIGVGRYVIMPTHIHLFVQGTGGFILSEWIRLLKRNLSHGIESPPPHWQEGFFDHLLRHDESYAQKWDYVRNNPVRGQLVAQPEDWPYQGEITRLIPPRL